jgi:hypothetical protein
MYMMTGDGPGRGEGKGKKEFDRWSARAWAVSLGTFRTLEPTGTQKLIFHKKAGQSRRTARSERPGGSNFNVQ